MSVCLYNCLSYPACKSHLFLPRISLYCYLWSVWLYQIFSDYLTNDKIFEKKNLLKISCVFWFSLIKFVWKISNSEKNSASYSCQILFKLEFPRHIFEKIFKFHENQYSVRPVVPCRHTDINDEADSRFSKFCERV